MPIKFLSRFQVEEVNSSVTELTKTATKERALLEECKDFLSMLAIMQVNTPTLCPFSIFSVHASLAWISSVFYWSNRLRIVVWEHTYYNITIYQQPDTTTCVEEEMIFFRQILTLIKSFILDWGGVWKQPTYAFGFALPFLEHRLPSMNSSEYWATVFLSHWYLYSY